MPSTSITTLNQAWDYYKRESERSPEMVARVEPVFVALRSGIESFERDAGQGLSVEAASGKIASVKASHKQLEALFGKFVSEDQGRVDASGISEEPRVRNTAKQMQAADQGLKRAIAEVIASLAPPGPGQTSPSPLAELPETPERAIARMSSWASSLGGEPASDSE